MNLNKNWNCRKIEHTKQRETLKLTMNKSFTSNKLNSNKRKNNQKTNYKN